MQVVSINRGDPKTHLKGNETEVTGIYKVPVAGPVYLSFGGIESDFIGDSKSHGGLDQALYIYGLADYAWWNGELGRVLEPGTFGENLTISELESAYYAIGDRLRVGEALLEVTAPRTPCSTLAARMGDMGFVKRYRAAERPGLYCRVIEPGAAQSEDAVVRLPYNGPRVLIVEMFRNHYRRDLDERERRRMLEAPISMRARSSLEHDLHGRKADTGG